MSDNSTLNYYVGLAPYHKQGILLYNPKTRQTIVRRSFQQFNIKDKDISQLSLLISDDLRTIPNISSRDNQQIQSPPDDIDYWADPVDINQSTIDSPDINLT